MSTPVDVSALVEDAARLIRLRRNVGNAAYEAQCEEWLRLASLSAVGGEPVAWIRFCSDGSYEGPIVDAGMEDVRKRSGAWTPLYAHPPSGGEQKCGLSHDPSQTCSEWRAIETAPRDGTRVLTYRVGFAESMAVAWRGDIEDWRPVYGSAWPDPTHWMPLPAPPAEHGTELPQASATAETPSHSRQPLTDEQMQAHEAAAFESTVGDTGLIKHWWRNGFRAAERAHGIGGATAHPKADSDTRGRE